jgi:cephalosporin-C deacetylase
VDTPYRTIDVQDVSFRGFGGDRIGAWFTVPRAADGPLPAVVEFIGDPHGSDPSTPGFMTRGIRHPDTYFYRRVFTDAVRAVDAMRTLPGVDATRVAVQGASQGGGITLAVAGLVPDLVAAMPDVPFLCHFERALDICDKDPYSEITRYLAVHRPQVDEVLHTLSYFDGVNFAKRATAPALFSVAIMDLICPPSTVYAAYNHYADGRADGREIEVYRYNNHEGGESYQRQSQICWLNALLEKG